jgi:hypothetical protein
MAELGGGSGIRKAPATDSTSAALNTTTETSKQTVITVTQVMSATIPPVLMSSSAIAPSTYTTAVPVSYPVGTSIPYGQPPAVPMPYQTNSQYLPYPQYPQQMVPPYNNPYQGTQSAPTPWMPGQPYGMMGNAPPPTQQQQQQYYPPYYTHMQ